MLGPSTRESAGEAPGATGEGSSFCTLGLAEDFGRSVLQRCWTLQSPVHSGSDKGGQQGWARGDKTGERQSKAGQGQMASVEADFPTSNCFCYLIMSQTGKHPPPHLSISGATFAAGPGEVPRNRDKTTGCSLRLQSSNQDPADSTPRQLLGMGTGRWCWLRFGCGAQCRKISSSQGPPEGQLQCQARLAQGSFCIWASVENNLLPLTTPCYSRLTMGKLRSKAVREPAPITAVQARAECKAVCFTSTQCRISPQL